MTQNAHHTHPLLTLSAEDMLDRLNDLAPLPANIWQEGFLPAIKPAEDAPADAYLNHLSLSENPDLPAHLLTLKNTLPPGTPLFITLFGEHTRNPTLLTPLHTPSLQAAGDLLTRLGLALPAADDYTLAHPGNPSEVWHIITLHAHTPAESLPKPKQRGSGKISLVRILGS